MLSTTQSPALALLAGLLLLPLANPAPASTTPGITRVYPVADLVIPVVSPNNILNRPNQSQERHLMALLRSCIAPESWSGQGGNGTMEYFPLTLSLVVTQSAAIHNQLAELLEQLRRNQDIEIQVELRFVTITAETLRRLELADNPEDSPPAQVILDPSQLYMLLETVQGDQYGNVLQCPRLAMLNGQLASLHVGEFQDFVVGADPVQQGERKTVQPRVRSVSTELKVHLLPVVSPDERQVTLQLSIQVQRNDAPSGKHASDWQVEKTLKLTPGSTAVLSGFNRQREMRQGLTNPIIDKIPYLRDLFATLSFGRENKQVLVLVTPRILNRKVPTSSEEDTPANKWTIQQETPTTPATRSESVVRETTGSPNAVMQVNNKRFELTFRLENVGPSKIERVDLWYTREDRKWVRYPGKVDPSSPALVRVPEDGCWGFTLIPCSGAGLAPPQPSDGEAPQVWVQVDTTRPIVELERTQRIPDHPDTVEIRWRAEDANLPEQPVTLEWAPSQQGPWTIIDEPRIPNIGKWLWHLPRSMPSSVYIRLTVRDRAGNASTVTTPDPLWLDDSVPRATILQVRSKE